MMELYDTKTFISNEIVDGKPVNGTSVSYCAYCGEVAIKDEDWDGYTRIEYRYCNCDAANFEKRFKEKKRILDSEQRQELWKLKQTYRDKGVII